MPVRCILEGMADGEDSRLAQARPDYLQSNGQSAVVESARDRQCRNAGQVEYPAKVVPRERLKE